MNRRTSWTSITTASLEGSATYNGRAAGVFVTKDDMGLPANSGEFTANATLTANFAGDDLDLADQYQISGSVTGFVLMDGDTMVDNTWMLTLNPAQFSTRAHDPNTGVVLSHSSRSGDGANMFSGTTDGGAGAANAGEWNGMFFGANTVDEDNVMPSGVAGEFLGPFLQRARARRVRRGHGSRSRLILNKLVLVKSRDRTEDSLQLSGL